MRIITVKDYEALSKDAASFIKDEIVKKPNLVLGLATGSTPLGVYHRLALMHKKEGLDFSRLTTFNLDEYYRLPEWHKQSYHCFMDTNLFNGVNIKKENLHIPNGLCENVDEECSAYDESIAKEGGIDMQILGLGVNGHIGFNEPGEELILKTHLTSLAPSTIAANSRFFNDIHDVPVQAITMGIGTIMKARKVLLLASGKGKAGVISKIIKGSVSSSIPASLLNLHPDASVIIDEDALNNP